MKLTQDIFTNAAQRRPAFVLLADTVAEHVRERVRDAAPNEVAVVLLRPGVHLVCSRLSLLACIESERISPCVHKAVSDSMRLEVTLLGELSQRTLVSQNRCSSSPHSPAPGVAGQCVTLIAKSGTSSRASWTTRQSQSERSRMANLPCLRQLEWNVEVVYGTLLELLENYRAA